MNKQVYLLLTIIIFSFNNCYSGTLTIYNKSGQTIKNVKMSDGKWKVSRNEIKNENSLKATHPFGSISKVEWVENNRNHSIIINVGWYGIYDNKRESPRSLVVG